MENISFSYREVIPDAVQNWKEITLNTGGTQSTTLQDIKVADRAGGFCFGNPELHHNRNRFIYWRTYQDVLELSEISLDFNLYSNNLRYKFTDSPVLSVSITEGETVTVLVTTVCSLHRLNFPHPDTLADGSSSSVGSGGSTSCSTSGASYGGGGVGTGGGGTSVDFNDTQSFSIFRDANANTARDPNNFYVIENPNSTTHNPVPYAASSFLSANGEEAYFALACQAQLMLYVMDLTTGQTQAHQLKEHHIMPRIFANIKEALTGRGDPSDSEFATSLVFSCIDSEVYLLALYRNEHLRIWSTSTYQSIDTLNCVREGGEQRMQGPQSNLLRKLSETSVCAFLSHSTGSEFVCINIVPDASNANALNLVRRKVINAPELDLADFDVSPSRIWALWSNAEGEFSISSFSLMRGMGMNWVSAAMEPPPERYCIGVEHGMDPREAYCSYIFHPGKFDAAVISKALFMFRRSTVQFDAKHCTMAMLKEHVAQAVEDELQNELKDFDLFNDEDYLSVSTRLWERFYSCCEQYHLKASQPTGLVILEPVDGVCVVKKSSFSLLRPCEMLEHLMLSGDNVDAQVIVPIYFAGEERVAEDLLHLVMMLAQIENWLPEDVKIDIDRKLFQLEMPNAIIAQLSDSILAGDPNREILPSNFLVVLHQKLQAIKHLRHAINFLLDSLRMDNGDPKAMQTHTGLVQSSRFLMSMGTLFGSQVGVSILVETVRQTSMIRFAICRNLLLLQQLLIDSTTLPMDMLEVLRSQFMPDTVIFLQSYYAMLWITETPLNLSTISVMEPSIQRLQQLQLISGSGRLHTGANKSNVSLLLSIFLNSKGLYTALALYAESFKTLENGVHWQQTLLPLTTIISQLIWPVSMNFIFGEWLFGTCQHVIIEGYVRLLNNWCEWNICSRQFMLATSHLDCGEAYKAYDLFLQSAKGVLKEPYLLDKMLKDTPLSLGEQPFLIDDDDSSATATAAAAENILRSNQALAHYYLKVIQLFEQHEQLDYIISVAQVVIGVLEKTDPQLPMFQSIVFNNHLQLEHYEKAYHSLIYNADSSRRKDCLRQLVVTLFNRKRLDLLMHFPYVGLHEEFENIVESRARLLVIEHNIIYDFLYAFHVNNGNMRKASAVMYEKAMRLQFESESIESLQKRYSALLVCLNALHLIDERYRWIAKPVIDDDGEASNAVGFGGAAAALGAGHNGAIKHQVVVLEVKDIRRELLHTEALVRLAQHRKDFQVFIKSGPQELAMILASCGLFTSAIKLGKGFNFTLLPIFESLTAACVRTADENANEAWSWLQDNDLADLPHRNAAPDMAWSLLQKLVQAHEKSEQGETQIRKSVVNKLLGLNVFVPQWLYNSYKSDNCAELLHLYVKHNRLLEASELAQELLCAMLGAGSEYFSCKHAIAVTNAEMCLPLHTLDLLLHGLKLNGKSDVEYKQAAVELEDVIQKYLSTALNTANDKIKMAYQV